MKAMVVAFLTILMSSEYAHSFENRYCNFVEGRLAAQVFEGGRPDIKKVLLKDYREACTNDYKYDYIYRSTYSQRKSVVCVNTANADDFVNAPLQIRVDLSVNTFYYKFRSEQFITTYSDAITSSGIEIEKLAHMSDFRIKGFNSAKPFSPVHGTVVLFDKKLSLRCVNLNHILDYNSTKVDARMP
jgi:hypothetical protein